MSTKGFLLACVLCLGLLCAKPADAAVIVGPDPTATWLGFMNVSNLPADGGAYQFGGVWGTADLTATWSGDVLTLGPNTIGDPDPYWYKGGGGPGAQGNKNMDANMYVQSDALVGETVTFTGKVLSNTLVEPYTSVAFIKDFAPDFSSFNQVTVPLTPGDFSITLATNPAAGRHVQYGFETIGPNVWATDVGPKGNVRVTAVPEPGSALLVGFGCAVATLRLRRSRRA